MLTPQVTLYRVDKQKLIPEYLLYFFQLYTFQIILEGNAKQSTRNYIGITNQKKMWIYLPDAIEEQKELVAPIIKVDKEVIGKQIKIKTLQRLKKSLMQNLLTGKVRVDLEAINKIISEQ
jgi:type I restriction enzyme S subunit